MGLADAMARVIFVVVTITAASVVAAVAIPAARELVESRDALRERGVEQLAHELTVTNVSYDASSRVATVTARNDGRVVEEIDRLTLLVDGVARVGATGTLDGSPTEVWAPGERVTLRIADVASMPSRVVVSGASATPQVVQLGEPGAVAAGVGMYVGPGGNLSRYFHSLTVGASGTSLSGVFKTKNAADTTVQDVVRVYNAGGAPATVHFTGPRVTNATAEVFTWTVKNGSTTVGTLDHRADSPSVSFTLPAGHTYRLTLRIDLAEGSGKHNAQFDFGLQMVVNG